MDYTSSSYILNQVFNVALIVYNSTFFMVVKFIIAIYVTVLFADVLMLIIARLRKNVRTLFLGMNIPAISQKKMHERWSEIEDYVKSDNISKYKMAIIKADTMADQIIAGFGFKGANMSERLANVGPGQIDNRDDLIKAHEVRNQIIKDRNFVLNQKATAETVSIYEKFLKNFEYL